MHKKIIIIFTIIFIIGISAFAIWNNNNEISEEDKLKEKVNEEMKYLGNTLIEIANELNNITINKYKVSEQTKNMSNEGGNEEESSSSSSSNKEENSNQNNTSSKKSDSVKTYDMVLSSDKKEINWNEIDNNMDLIYTTWSQMVIDLYKLNNDNEKILSFSRQIDETEKYIKSNDKINSLQSIAKLYTYIPLFISNYDSQNTRKINLENTKSNILNAYSLIEIEKWEDIYNEIINSENNYNKVLNDINNNKNQYNLNKGYILIKEFQNSVELQDKNILYIKYKNLIEEIINID